jgi:kynureninase
MDRYFEATLNYAKAQDEKDELAQFRERFHQIEWHIYMDGNSLGLCSRDAETAVLNMLRVWKENGILLWNIEEGHYYQYSRFLAKLIAPLIGVSPEEVCISGNTTINIHQAISTFYKPDPKRYKILVDELNFPTDIYAVHSQALQKGLDPAEAVKVVPSVGGNYIDEDAVIAAMTGDVALVLLSAVYYRSAQLLDIVRLSAEAHKRGIIIGWDLCHSIGSVPHDLAQADADFAVWCNYKYLSGGPGCTAGLYINRRHFDLMPGLWGWFGNNPETQFKMSHSFEKAPDAEAWQTGTLSLLAMAPLEGTLRIYNEAGMTRIREKSLRLTSFLMFLIDERLKKYGFSCGNPSGDSKRGGHVALTHYDAYRINLALKNHKVIPDFREPDVIRLAPVALYNTYTEVYTVVEILEKIMLNSEYETFENQRSAVV